MTRVLGIFHLPPDASPPSPYTLSRRLTSVDCINGSSSLLISVGFGQLGALQISDSWRSMGSGVDFSP